jgi:hypothetical protein
LQIPLHGWLKVNGFERLSVGDHQLDRRFMEWLKAFDFARRQFILLATVGDSLFWQIFGTARGDSSSA